MNRIMSLILIQGLLITTAALAEPNPNVFDDSTPTPEVPAQDHRAEVIHRGPSSEGESVSIREGDIEMECSCHKTAAPHTQDEDPKPAGP